MCNDGWEHCRGADVPKFSARWRPLRPRRYAVHEFFAGAGDGRDACGCVLLLLSELAAALLAEPE